MSASCITSARWWSRVADQPQSRGGAHMQRTRQVHGASPLSRSMKPCSPLIVRDSLPLAALGAPCSGYTHRRIRWAYPGLPPNVSRALGTYPGSLASNGLDVVVGMAGGTRTLVGRFWRPPSCPVRRRPRWFAASPARCLHLPQQGPGVSPEGNGRADSQSSPVHMVGDVMRMLVAFLATVKRLRAPDPRRSSPGRARPSARRTRRSPRCRHTWGCSGRGPCPSGGEFRCTHPPHLPW